VTDRQTDTQTDRQTDRQTDIKWVPIWRAGDEWPVLIPKLLAIARSLDKTQCNFVNNAQISVIFVPFNLDIRVT
jgi:hypothetical protein